MSALDENENLDRDRFGGSFLFGFLVVVWGLSPGLVQTFVCFSELSSGIGCPWSFSNICRKFPSYRTSFSSFSMAYCAFTNVISLVRMVLIPIVSFCSRRRIAVFVDPRVFFRYGLRCSGTSDLFTTIAMNDRSVDSLSNLVFGKISLLISFLFTCDDLELIVVSLYRFFCLLYLVLGCHVVFYVGIFSVT